MKWLYDFDEPLPAGTGDARALLGGKGLSLREMTLAELAVPPGFTVTTEACARYLAGGRRWPEGLEAQVREAVARLERVTGRRYGAGGRPLLVSVRSGAAVSMPGMMDTILNCGLHRGLAAEVGDTPDFWRVYLQFITLFARVVHGIEPAEFERLDFGHAAAGPDRAAAARYLDFYAQETGEPFPEEPWAALRQCIEAVFASWLNERAQAYRRRNDIQGLAGTAVNVQAMFPSEVSGIVFTRDPNALDADRMVIESSYGLGEAIVSGHVTPDRFLVSRADRRVTATLGHKAAAVDALGGPASPRDPDAPSLDEAGLAELAGLALRVEAHFGHPVDIEFGRAGGRFALLQARRIRGLEVAEDVEIGRQEEIVRLRGLADARPRVWVVHNLAETLRAPRPLTWDIVRNFMRGDGGFGRLYRDLGYRPTRRVREEGFLELICGRIYADPERLAELFWGGMPLAYDNEAVLADKSLLDRAPTRLDPERADGRFLAELPRTLWAMLRAARIGRRARRDARRRFEEDVLPPYLAYVREARAVPLAGLDDAALVAELNARCRRVLDEFGPESLKPGFFGGVAFDALCGRLARILGDGHGTELACTLTRALEGDTTFEQDNMLHTVAAGGATLAAFLDRFGHRAVGEMELAVPRWREDATYLEQTVQRLAAGGRNPAEAHAANRRQREEAERELPGLLARAGGSVFEQDVLADLRDAQALLPYRESGKHYLMMGYELIRQACEELGRRWELGGRLYYLRLEELPAYAADPARFGERIEARRVRHLSAQRLDPSDVIDSRALEGLGLPPPLADASVLSGTAVASGVATGRAAVVFDPAAAGDIGTGYILVCPSTDPGWTPLFMHARGLVVERGGVLSHGAIVARDFGIPAAVCANATRAVKTGDLVRVDGNRGTLTVLERGKAG